MSQSPLTLRRWTRVEYEKLVDLGLLHGDPVELIGGQLVVAEPQGSDHATAVGAADDALRAILPPVSSWPTPTTWMSGSRGQIDVVMAPFVQELSHRHAMHGVNQFAAEMLIPEIGLDMTGFLTAKISRPGRPRLR
jgi:hypothetical protein